MLDSQITYSLQGIIDVSLLIQKRPEDYIGTAFSFELKVNQRADENKEVLITFVEIVIYEENKSFALVNFEMGCAFKVENFKKFVPKDDKGIFDVPPTLSQPMTAISVSTVRGCLFEKLKGTYLHKAILPIIMIDEMEMIKIDTP